MKPAGVSLGGAECARGRGKERIWGMPNELESQYCANIKESLPSQATMSARPKPWEIATPHEPYNPSQYPNYQPQAQTYAPGQISPTLLQFQQRSSYSSSTNSPSIFTNQASSSRDSYDAAYTGSVSNWTTSGPTISPDLSFETFSLDPDLSTGLHSGSSSGLTTNTGSVGTPFDDSTYNNYLNVDYDPLVNPNQNPVQLAPPIASPAFQSSGSTPAPGASIAAQAPTEDTPTTSYSL